jgi:catechol-2,3-dioxygenase
MDVLTAMIFAKDVAAMAEFYRRGFGLAPDTAGSSDGFVVLEGHGARVALHALPDHVAATIEVDDPPRARTGVAIKLLFRVEDVAGTRSQLEELGAQAFETGEDDAVDLLDPEGNVVRIYREVDVVA